MSQRTKVVRDTDDHKYLLNNTALICTRYDYILLRADLRKCLSLLKKSIVAHKGRGTHSFPVRHNPTEEIYTHAKLHNVGLEIGCRLFNRATARKIHTWAVE